MHTKKSHFASTFPFQNSWLWKEREWHWQRKNKQHPKSEKSAGSLEPEHLGWKQSSFVVWPGMLLGHFIFFLSFFFLLAVLSLSLPGSTSGEEFVCHCRRCQRRGFDHWIRKIPWRREWQPTPVFLPEESHSSEEPVGLQSMGSQRLGHDLNDLAGKHWVFILACRSFPLQHAKS